MAMRLAFGLLYYLGILSLFVYFVDVKFVVAYILYNLMESTIFLGGMSWLWHLFLDPENVKNEYVSSMTILNGTDNIWGEDFHVIHHESPTVHWSDTGQHFEKTKEKYAQNNATIFEKTEEGVLLGMLFSGDWDQMAKHYVDLNGKLSHEEKKELLLKRASFIYHNI